MEQQTMKVGEAAKMLGIGLTAAYAAVRKGEIPAFKIGKTWLVSRPRLEAMINGTDKQVA